MPKTPSQKKNSRRKRVSLGRQEENQTRRRFVFFIPDQHALTLVSVLPHPGVFCRFSKGRRSNLRGSSVKSLNFIVEEESVPTASAPEVGAAARPKRATRKNKQSKIEEPEDVAPAPKPEEAEDEKPAEEQETQKSTAAEGEDDSAQPPPGSPAPDGVASVSSAGQAPPTLPMPEVLVSVSSKERLSAENAKSLECSPGRTATKLAIANVAQASRRSSVRCSLKLRHSLAGLRHSRTQEALRRASRRSMLKKKVARTTNSQCSSNNEGEERLLRTLLNMI